MDENTGTPNLNKALAAVQAALPKVSKDQEGKVSGEKDGRRYSYSYKYADLADLSDAVLPLLGKHGLAFSAFPGLNEAGKFGLTYALLHESGEEKGGFYPITPGTPQQNGSAITYARRYCLGAATGIAPAEDDDGAAGAHAQGGGEEDWRNQPPVPPRRQANGHAGTASNDPFAADEWAEQALQRALALKDAEAARVLWHEVSEAAKGGGISEKQRDDLHEMITAQVEDLKREQAKVTTATAPDGDPWQAKIEEITSKQEADDAIAELDQAHADGRIDDQRHKALRAAMAIKGGSKQGALA